MIKIKTVYLAGTIQSNKATNEVITRFSILQAMLEELGLVVFNPVRGKKVGDRLYYSNEIVHRDEYDIDRADLLVALFPFLSYSIGTPMEIYRAREICKIPVVVISPHKVIREHHWIRAKATYITADIQEAITYMKDWYL